MPRDGDDTTDNNSTERKYDSTLDALKMTEAEYQNAVTTAVSEIQAEHGLVGTDPEVLKDAAKDHAQDHEWFQSFDGATFGAIVEWSGSDPLEVQRWQLENERGAALRQMAVQTFEQDIIDQIDGHLSSIDHVEVELA